LGAGSLSREVVEGGELLDEKGVDLQTGSQQLLGVVDVGEESELQ
jgi:hypothetical protein